MIHFLLVSILLISCAKTPKEEVLEAIDLALTYLSSERCEDAINILEKVGRQNDNAVYLEVLASAYACRAGFSTIRFIGDDIPNLDTSSFANLLKSVSILSLSPETAADSSSYSDMRTGFNIIFQSDGGPEPSQVNRATKYGARKSGDMGVEALLFSMVQLGKFINYYGNVDASGVKGLGAGVSRCFIDYTFGLAQAARVAGGGSCNGNNFGHADLSVLGGSAATGIRRRCEGLMLFTNILDILQNMDLSGSDSLRDLEEAGDEIVTLKESAITARPSLSTLLNMTSQSLCETTLASPAEMDNMELIYALFYETGLQ